MKTTLASLGVWLLGYLGLALASARKLARRQRRRTFGGRVSEPGLRGRGVDD